MKILIVLALLAILLALFSALFGLLRPDADRTRTVRALTLRIALSIGLFLLLIASRLSGGWGSH
ncbi:twin transmembrane helix small protein [Aquitalea sp. S1-19]|uniref:Twin transmembrane helix small protein n=1 Tax=Craterilacuibacter sinensis TaxID=2686017 RepID=A0A845BIS7_9NEIS|nr:twin transmembrane helix small protein [Craterilacuibacter sinensis]MCP9759215.1 twin transmembrane helix small protein [Aquitalea sp. S1-19]MXR36082.1 twin transmembrane helix small protein [Craterilacuibacter sinensis]